MVYLIKRLLQKSQMSLLDWHNPEPHHKAYDKTTASGKVVHIAAKGPQVQGREHIAVGMKVRYKTPAMQRRRTGTITGESKEGWHITGQRQGYALHGDEHMHVVVGREHIWTEAEHSADMAPKGTHIATSSQDYYAGITDSKELTLYKKEMREERLR